MNWAMRIAAAATLVAVVATIQHWRVNSVPRDRVWQPTAAPGLAHEIDLPLEDADVSGSVAPRSDFASSDRPHSVENRIDMLVHRAEAHSDIFERFEAIAGLGDSDDDIAEIALLNLLYDPDARIREAVVETLGVIGTRRAIQGLDFALSDRDRSVRMTAIEILAEIGSQDAIHALAQTVREPDPAVRLAAVTELGEIRSLAARSVLEQFLSDDDRALRELAAAYLEASEIGVRAHFRRNGL
jgi:HEAT repeat protein